MNRILTVILGASLIAPMCIQHSYANEKTGPQESYTVSSYSIDKNQPITMDILKYNKPDNYLSGTINGKSNRISHMITKTYVEKVSDNVISPGTKTYGTEVDLYNGVINIYNSTYSEDVKTIGNNSIQLPRIEKTNTVINTNSIKGTILVPVSTDSGTELISISK